MCEQMAVSLGTRLKRTWEPSITGHQPAQTPTTTQNKLGHTHQIHIR